MYSKPKYGQQSSKNESPARQNRSVPSSPVSGFKPSFTASSGAYGRRGSGDWPITQQYIWRSRFNSLGGSTGAGGGCLQDLAIGKNSEPEHSEAFVEESGIKVVDVTSSLDGEDEDSDDLDDEDDVVHEDGDGEEDPLIELDMWDDTIVEEGEDEDSDEDHKSKFESSKHHSHHSTERHADHGVKSTSSFVQDSAKNNPSITVPVSITVPENQSSSDQIQNSSSITKVVTNLSKSPLASVLSPPDNSSTKNSTSSIGSNSSNVSSSTNSSIEGHKANGYLSDSAQTVVHSTNLPDCVHSQASKIPSVESIALSVHSATPVPISQVSTTEQSSTLSPSSSPVPICIHSNNSSTVYSKPTMHAQPGVTSRGPYSSLTFSGNMRSASKNSDISAAPGKTAISPGTTSIAPYFGYQSGVVGGGMGRGKTNKFMLPLNKFTAPRRKFVIRKVSEPEAPAKKTSSYNDPRFGELRNSDVGIQLSRGPMRKGASPIWLRRQMDSGNSNAAAKSPQISLDATGDNGSVTDPSSNNAGTSVLSESQDQPHDTSKQDQHTQLSAEKGEGDASISSTHGEKLVHSQTPHSFRPRAGTWSMANSRRYKRRQETEEEATRERRKSGDDIVPPSGQHSVFNRRDAEHGGIFQSFRPRSKSDAKASHTRQRRKSGDDVLNTTAKEKKKEASPGFFEAFRPRSKSDATRQGKKSTFMANIKNAVQHTLVSTGPSQRSGRRSGDATPVEQQTTEDVYHTWHAGSKTAIGRVWDVFRPHRSESTEEKIRRKSGGRNEKGQLNRRHSIEPDKRQRHGSGTICYVRGDNPDQAASTFRDCRGLPVAAAFLEKVSRSELVGDESQILVKFFKYHRAYDLIPTSAKLVIFDTRLQVKKAFFALVSNVVRAAPLWDSKRQEFVGMLTITDFIRILQSFYMGNQRMEELEDHTLEMWRTLLHDDVKSFISISPNASLYDAIKTLIQNKIHRLPVIDPCSGNVLYIITHKRILKFLYLYINELPKPSIMQQSLGELKIGSYENIETARQETLIIEALDKFVNRRVSALPIVDTEGKLIDIYAKFDVINLAAKGTYNKLDVTLQEANEYRNEWFEGVRKCNFDETLGTIMERIVKAEVHRLVVVDKEDKVIGVISLSDILNELVLKPSNESLIGLKETTIAQMDSQLACETGQSMADAPCKSSSEEICSEGSPTHVQKMEQDHLKDITDALSFADGQARQSEDSDKEQTQDTG